MLKRLQQVEVHHLSMVDQDLSIPFHDQRAPGILSAGESSIGRLFLLIFPLTLAALVGVFLYWAFEDQGFITFFERVLIAVMVMLAAWESLPSVNAILGLFAKAPRNVIGTAPPLSVAVLVTIRDEDAKQTLIPNLDLLRALQGNSPHQFALHVLSDSREQHNINRERWIVRDAQLKGAEFELSYHHRPINADYKAGNIRNWVTHFGAEFEAFIVMDADSQLDAGTAIELATTLSTDPSCSLVQTIPVVISGGTIWQRMQATASDFYGRLQGLGLAAWMGSEANYYGHNAIVRTKAFAHSAGLPRLRNRGPWGGTIMSHDFVEAALLRRAGWSVRILPTSSGTYEQAPVDVVAHLRRDARWCWGNFQHGRVMGSAGLHRVSRFHFACGMFSYFSSVLWLLLLILWSTIDSSVLNGGFAFWVLLLIASNLFLPRVLGLLHMALRQHPARNMGSAALKVGAETLLSSLLAPALMVQRVKIVFSVLANRPVSWKSHNAANFTVLDYFVFHASEVIIGLGMIACFERGWLTTWFLPLAICLTLAPVLSWTTAQTRPSVHTKN
jgi:membrane glycosyltransferase